MKLQVILASLGLALSALAGRTCPWTKELAWEWYRAQPWFHDLYRPSLRPYDPKEIDVIKRFTKLADEDFAGKNK